MNSSNDNGTKSFLIKKLKIAKDFSSKKVLRVKDFLIKRLIIIKTFVILKTKKLKKLDMNKVKDSLKGFKNPKLRKFRLDNFNIKKFRLDNFKIKKEALNTRTVTIAVAAVLFMTFSLVQYKKGHDHELATRACNVKLGNVEIGVARDKEEIEKLFSSIQKDLAKDYGLEIAINEELTFEEIHAEDEQITSKSIIEKDIKENLTFKVVAYAINIDGKDFSYLGSEILAKEVLAKIQEPYKQATKQEGLKIEGIKIVENVKIVKREVEASEVKEFDKVLALLQKGTDEERTHVVEKGENYWTIAKKYNIKTDDLEKANPNKDPKLIHPGDEISLVVPKPYLTVATYEEKTYTEDIKFETEYEYNDNMFKDQQSVKKKGVSGKNEVVAKVERHNGIEIAKEILKETILSQPIAQVIVKGTKNPPPKQGTGSFIMPTRGTLSSRFGKRWGKMHEGIDLAARTGTAINAADGGTVTFAGTKSGYGYVVDIDHGGGYVTRYAHCSKLYVKKGEKVYKGQHIAAVGSTGRSTGPHLHFEVRKNGVAQNPYNFLGKDY